MVAHPVGADDDEAQRVGEQLGQQVPSASPRSFSATFGDVEAQDEQRDRDREDAVAERDEPVDVTPDDGGVVRHFGHVGMSPSERTSSRSATSSSVVILMRSLAKSSCSMPSTTLQLVPSLRTG